MIENPDELRSFLRSVALWQFGLNWDEGELRFVKSKMLPPSTLESISQEIQALRLDNDLEAQLLECIVPVEEDGDADEQVGNFQRIATHHESLNGNRNMLLGLSIRLLGVLKHKPKSSDEATLEENKHRYNFAVGMNEIVANSFMHITGILEGIMRGIKKTSPEEIVSSERDEQERINLGIVPEQEPTDRQAILNQHVTEMITILSGRLREHYSTPLYTKHKAKWNEIATRDQVTDSPTNKFLGGKITDVEFLSASETQRLSTEQISGIFFLKAVVKLENQENFKGFIQRIPEGLLNQIKPTLIGILDKSLSILSGISIERTTVRVVGFIEQVLDCCDAMQVVKKEQARRFAESIVMISPETTTLALALQAGEIDSEVSGYISQLHTQIPNQDTQGSAIIDRLGGGAHEVVQTFQKDPVQSELDWIEDTAVKLKRLLREKTSDYTEKQEGQWLATLLENKENGVPTGLLGTLLDLQRKVRTYSPLAANILTILFSGLEKFIESEGITVVQEALDKVSSAGCLSSKIATLMMNSFLDVYTKDHAWREKLPFLRAAYLYLSPEEQQHIKDHLKFLYFGEKLAQRERDLTGAGEQASNEKTIDLLRREASHAEALKYIEQANEQLQKRPEENAAHIRELQRAYGELKRQKGLIQFERIKGLVLFVANDHLSKIFSSYGGGAVLAVIMTVIEEAFDLLRYQKVVKHWIFTIVDILVKELQVVSGLKPTEEEDLFQSRIGTTEDPSILEIMEAHKLSGPLMDKLSTTASNCNRSWGQAGMLASLNYTASAWTGILIWGQIKKAFNEASRITPNYLADKTIGAFFDFAKDPNGLSTVVIEALTEHVADPRPQELIELVDPRGDHIDSESSSSNEQGYETAIQSLVPESHT